MVCKTLSFHEIHETNKFFKDCEECRLKNYRKNLELEYENAKFQQTKMDLLYWKQRAENEGSKQLVDLYEKFNAELQKRASQGNTPGVENGGNNDIQSLPDMKMGAENSGVRANPLARAGPTINEVLDSAERLINRQPLTVSDLTGPLPASVANNSNVNNMLDSAEALLRRVRPVGPMGISADLLANSRAGLRPTNTRPASEAPASNPSNRAEFINELTNTLRIRRGSRSSGSSSGNSSGSSSGNSSLANSTTNSPQQLSPEGSTMGNARQQAQAVRRFREQVLQRLETAGVAGPAPEVANVPPSNTGGSGFKSKGKVKGVRAKGVRAKMGKAVGKKNTLL